jgi:hypothetical protein
LRPDTQATASTCKGWSAKTSAPRQAARSSFTIRRTIAQTRMALLTWRSRFAAWKKNGSRCPPSGFGSVE